MSNQQKALALLDRLEKAKTQLQERLAAAEQSLASWQHIQTASALRLKQLKPKIKINVGGKLFLPSKMMLLRWPLSVFSVMLSTQLWNPEDGIYFFDRNAAVFNHVLIYLAVGSVSLDIVSSAELTFLKEDLDFFHVPFFIDESNKKLREPDPMPASELKGIEPLLQSARDKIHAIQSKDYKLHLLSINEARPQHGLIASAVSALDDMIALEVYIRKESVKVTDMLEQWKKLSDTVQALAATPRSTPLSQANSESSLIDDDLDVLATSTISWDPAKRSESIQLRADNQIANSAADSRFQVALGTEPVTYIKYQLNHLHVSHCMVGLAPPTRPLVGGQYNSSGYYIDLFNGKRYDQQGIDAPLFGRALKATETIEFRYDKEQQSISVRYGSESSGAAYQKIWNLVTGDLTAVVELFSGPHSIEIVASES